MDKRQFSELLRMWMKQKDLSQAQLARKSKLSRQAISNFINQVSLPSPESCIALANGLEFPPDFILEVVGHKPSRPNANRELDEANYKFAQLPDWQQRLVLSFIDTLLREGSASPASPNATLPSNSKS